MRQAQLGGGGGHRRCAQGNGCHAGSQKMFHDVPPFAGSARSMSDWWQVLHTLSNVLYTRNPRLRARQSRAKSCPMERKRSDRIADELEGLIFDGTFPDGARLDEVMLAERFDVSRTPIREALHRLTLS
ncbi:MAG: GntR family transcriptional regulator, partial [Sagittula sp.]